MSKSKQIRGRRAAARIADALTGSIGRTSGATPQSEVTLGALSPAEQARFRLAIQERGFEDPKALLAATYEGRASDPVKWIRERLGEHPWSKQREILESIRDHRYTAVPSCHDVGKSFIAARAAAYWIENHPPGEAFVVTTAPTWRQVKNILWRELGRAHARGKLIGRMNQTEWALTMPAGNEETVAFGNKPADMDPSAFQGIHARYVLVIFDEACHDDQTDVMTARGWVRFADLEPSDELLVMDPQTHAAAYRKPEKLIRRHYRGPMYEYTAKGANYCVTPDHEMYFHGRSGRAEDTAWRKAPVATLIGKTDKYMKKSIAWEGRETPTYTIPAFAATRKSFSAHTVPMDDWLTFLGWYCSEGSLIRPAARGGQPYGVTITQKSPEVLREIHRLCLRLKLPAKLYAAAVHIHSRQIGEHLAQLGTSCLTRRLPRYLSTLPPRQLTLFLDAYARGDGYRKGNGEIIYTSSPKMADDLQELILKTGVPSVVRRRALKGVESDLGTHIATSSCDGYVVTRPRCDTKIKHYPKNLNRINYDGTVYCARVPPEHLLFTRRNGYTLWSGNCGIPETLWNAAEGLVTNEDCRFLAIGNPDDPATEFANVCKPGSGWNVIHISAFDSPNFTGEWVPPEVRHVLVSQTWVEEKKRKWGEDNPVYISKVLGRFPDTSVDGLIPMGLIRAAQQRELAPSEPVELGIDVGGGGDKNVIAHRRGPVVRIIRRDQTNDTMQTLGNAMHAIRLTNATCAKIDAIGIGKGAADRAKEMGRLTKSADRATREIAKRIVGISVGESARDNEGYLNLRAEGYWGLRERFMAGDIDLDPNDDDLAAQLVEIRYTRTSSGKVQIESKSEMKKRNLHSPDDADAVMLSFLHAKADSVRPTWGKRDRNREGDVGRRASAARGDGRGVYRHR